MKGRKGYMMVKLDLEKVYDRLEWDFIYTTLEQFGIPPPLTQVIMACISTLGMSLNWNGSLTPQFHSSRGLRQGDPLSPYLFVLNMERLGYRILDAVESGSWSPLMFGRGNGPKLSHLFFADDLILIA